MSLGQSHHKLWFTAVLLVLLLAASFASGADCRSLIAGRTYAHHFSGFFNTGDLMPNAGGGYLHFNADGTITGLGTFSVGADVQLKDLPVTGSYQLASNPSTNPATCMGSAKLDNDGLVQQFQLLVTRNGDSIEFMLNDLFLSVGFTAEPMHAGRCKTETLNSTYGYNAKGWITPPPLPPEMSWFPMPAISGLIPFNFSGAIAFDGAGHLNGWDMVSLNGLLVPRTYTGEYKVDANCVASTTLHDSLGNPPIHTEVFILQGAKGILTVNTDPGTVLAFPSRLAE